MSMGIVGAIDPGGKGDLAVHYAVFVTYLIHTGWLNKIAARCKRCGRELEKGKGTKTVIAGGGPRPSDAYFCADCVAWVQGHTLEVVKRQRRDAAVGEQG
jgi:uncharacterized protein with PIN domain